jgi:hypothetical protein
MYLIKGIPYEYKVGNQVILETPGILPVTRSFFQILNFNLYPTLSVHSKNYPGLSVVSGNFETGSKYITDSNQ